MSKFQKLYDAIAQGKTLLGVGPMSFNTIDAAIEIANENKIPLLLIASRRQVECKEMGSGYVTDTETFAKYVKQRDVGNYVFLARDHGGPWQGTNEENLNHAEARGGALISYTADICCGFDILHLDPSLKPRPLEEIKKDVKFLYNTCETIASLAGKEIIYEAGTEEHGGHTTKPEDFEKFVEEVKKDCPKIKFVVGNMGLYVKEMQNVGTFDEEQAEKLVEICNKNGVYLKGHNADYLLNTKILSKHPKIGVHSINIAPQFGTVETKELYKNIHSDDLERLIDISYNSNKWKKWMIDDSLLKNKEYKATIAGHYVFSHPEVVVRKHNNPGLNEHLKKSVKENIILTLRQLGWHL